MSLRQALRRKNKNEKVLRPVHPNCGIEADYRRKLCAMVDEMHDSVLYWLQAAWRANEPALAEMAHDDVPANTLREMLARLTRRWQRAFNRTANERAKIFIRSVLRRTDRNLENILRKGGMSVKFRLTDAMRDVLNAMVHENVSLIRSIPQRYLQEVEGLVMRSVQIGGDLKPLATELRHRYQLTRKRAAFISRDQNSKANAVFTRVRQLELGVKEAVWLHSHAGKKPRPTHVAMNGRRYDIAKGMWDPAEKNYVWPGQLINCRCVGRSVVPGFS